MIKYINCDYKTSILFNAEEINRSECLMTLFYEMDYRLNKFIIQYYSNLHMGSRININNQLHIPIGSQRKPIKISICSTLSLIKVYIDRRLVYQEERSRSTKLLLLIGRPFFGKTITTFNQFYKQSSAKYIKQISFKGLNANDKTVGKYFSRSDIVERYEVRKSSHNLLNPLDRIKEFNLEIFNSFGEFHKVTFSMLINFIASQLRSEINKLINTSQITDGYGNIYDSIDNFQSKKLTISELEILLIRIIRYGDDCDIDEDLIFNICLDLLEKKNDSSIALYVLGEIYLNNKEYAAMIRVIRCIVNAPLDLDAIENYFIFLYSLSINRQTDYFNGRINSLISRTLTNNVVYFGILTSMLDILFNSFHYSKRGYQYKESINQLLIKISSLDEFEDTEYKNFTIGVINMMAQRPMVASSYFEKAVKMRNECSHYLIDSYEKSGKIINARNLVLKSILSTNRNGIDDSLVTHYTTLDNWVNKNIDFRYITETTDELGQRFKDLITHEGLNFGSIDNVYIADHNFRIGIKVSGKRKDGLIFQYSNAIVLYGNDRNISLKVEINGQILLLNVPNIDIGKLNIIEISRLNDVISLKVNDIVREVSITSKTIIYGGRIIFDKSSFDVIGYYVDIYGYQKIPKSNSLIIYSSWYGDEFTNLFFDSLIPSLSRADGLPSLMSDFNIEWRIYTSEEQKEKIVNRKSLVEHLTHKLGINTTILKSEAFDPREFLHETFIDCVKNGMEKNSIILFAPPDHIFGSGLRELVVESQVDSYIVCPHPRISYENAYESGEYKKLIYKNGLNSSAGYISNTELTTSAINKYAHQIVQYGINPDAIDGIKETSYWWNAKKSEDNLLVKFKEPPPVLLYARGDIIAGMLSDGYSSTFERVDHDLVEWMHKTHRLNVLRSNKNFFWVEYCKNGRNIPTLMNGYWPKSAQLIYDMPHIWKI